MNNLRDYQIECIETIARNFKNKDRQLIQLPTGAGKTWIFLNYLAKHSRSGLIVCPSIELKEQIYEAGKIFLGHHNISFGISKAPFAVITTRGLNTAHGKWETVVFDEAHHAQASTYRNFLDNHKGFKLLGCTATPERKDKKSLLEIFKELTFSRNIVDLINKGHLCDIEAYRIKSGIEIDSHRAKNGDFASIQLKELDIESRNKIIVKTFLKHCSKLKTLIFCLNVEHSKKIAFALKEYGISCESIDGTMKMNQRMEILKRFKSGETMALTNCQLLTEGFDEPSIEALLISRPTKSKSLYCQMIGRGLRNFPGKKICKLYELTDNSFKICSFCVAGGYEAENDFEYKEGTKLSQLSLNKITVEDVILNKEKINLFENQRFWDEPAFASQHVDIREWYPQDITFKEAAFLIWKNKLKEKYGFNKTKK